MVYTVAIRQRILPLLILSPVRKLRQTLLPKTNLIPVAHFLMTLAVRGPV